MANLKKYTRGEFEGLAKHIERTEKANKNINRRKTRTNYSLIESEKPILETLNETLNKVHHSKRTDLKVCCEWTINLPKRLLTINKESQRDFFEEVFRFLNTQYEEKNIIAACVHNDENIPHLHYCFMPIIKDEKTGEKFSTKGLITLNHLNRFHDNLEKHLKKQLPFYRAKKSNDPQLLEGTSSKSLHEQIGEFVTKNIEGINCLEDFESWYNEVKLEGDK